MENNRLVPAVWHTAINPYVNLGGSGYTMGGGTLSIYNNSLNENAHFQYISHWKFKFRDGSQYTCNVYSGNLFGGQGTMDLQQFDLTNRRSFAKWYAGSLEVKFSDVSAHGDLSSVTYAGYEIPSNYGSAITRYELTSVSARIRVNRGSGQKWYSAVYTNNPVVFGNSGITADDILNFNASGYSKFDFGISVSFEPVIKLWMVESPGFEMPWKWTVEYNDYQFSIRQIELMLKDPASDMSYATIVATTSTGFTTTGETRVQISGEYKNQPFILGCLSEIIGAGSNQYSIASTAATNTTLTTAGTETTLTLTKN